MDDANTTAVPAIITAPPTTTPPDTPGRWRESSDFVARYKFLYDRLLSQPPALTASVPSDVLSRLQGTNLTWTTLNTFAQRALLWDAGYVRVTATQFAKVLTPCGWGGEVDVGAPMSSIAFRSSDLGVTLNTCVNAVGEYYLRLNTSLPTQLRTPLKCAIEVFAPPAVSNSSLWSQDTLPSTTIPELSAQLHRSANSTHAAIHASPIQEPVAGTCPASDGSFVVPCQLVVLGTGWCRPEGSKLMASWLRDLQVLASRTKAPTAQPIVTSSPTKVAPLTPLPTNNKPVVPSPTLNPSRDVVVIVVGGAFGLFALFVGVCFMRWFHGKLKSMMEGSYVPVSTPHTYHPSHVDPPRQV
ncbi:hypothetical protein H310_06780 [Aphanomyces invadans]|uniref:Uncharacterized protein n=1 Tax=Aphanomyces invadans TaxID=157072 RepID=A0A024U6D7_9STRA|nr:hypothetical protein H310_06780 [Aphanomyces invadans]ETW01183.1 hypothetical protein H310_06780 [Aphanomyces invadans]RHY17512.1 hypothetical protein DYB32_010506 [Aphanomyces invadans]|eukprot:XP_008870181.1 hypothetical protein H310_06780 [Aphanomyces invadans]